MPLMLQRTVKKIKLRRKKKIIMPIMLHQKKPALPPVETKPAVAAAATPEVKKEDNSGLPKMGTFMTKTSVAAFYGPEMANRYFKNASTSDQSATTTTTEKFNPSYSAGARF